MIESGTKVKYQTEDGLWLNGVVHGVQKVDGSDGSPKVIGYLVDTGNDMRVDEYQRNPRGEAISKHYDKHRQAGLDHETAIDKAMNTKGLPKEGVTVEKVRQPEQVSVSPDRVRLA